MRDSVTDLASTVLPLATIGKRKIHVSKKMIFVILLLDADMRQFKRESGKKLTMVAEQNGTGADAL